MIPDVQALYQTVILDHGKHPRNFRALNGARRADGHNPVCGDRVTVHVRLDSGTIAEATFEGWGCAIVMASASMMTECVRDRKVEDVDALLQRVQRLVTLPREAPIDDLGAVSALAGVRLFPVRVACAILPWRTLGAAVHGLASLAPDVPR